MGPFKSHIQKMAHFFPEKSHGWAGSEAPTGHKFFQEPRGLP